MFLLFALLASVITVIRKNHNRRLKMGLTSHLSDAYDAFSSYCVSSSLLLSMMKMSLMTSLTMMVLGPVSPPVRAFIVVLNYLLVVLVDCHVMGSPKPFFVLVEYFQFLAQNFSCFKFRILNMLTVCCRFSHSFKIMPSCEPVCFEVLTPCTVQRLISGRGGEGNVYFTCCIVVQEP